MSVVSDKNKNDGTLIELAVRFNKNDEGSYEDKINKLILNIATSVEQLGHKYSYCSVAPINVDEYLNDIGGVENK